MTGLFSRTMPFIRYRIGDLGSWQEDIEDEPGLPFPVLASVEGRSLDVVRAPNGNKIGGTFWTILFRERPGIKIFQVVQLDRQELMVRVVLEEGAEEIDEEFFRRKISDFCGAQMQIEFRVEDEILP